MFTIFGFCCKITSVGDIMDNLLYMIWDWCAQQGVRDAFSILKTVLDILKIVVPIGLVVMTSFDIAKKVINPEEKEGQKKIMIRLIAALIVFFTPFIIKTLFWIIDVGNGTSGSYDNAKSGLSGCLQGW